MTIGSELRDARERMDIPLELIAARTKIGLPFLRAIETDAFDDLPRGIVRRGHLRAYAREVSLDPERVVARYVKECEPILAAAARPEPSLLLSVRLQAAGERVRVLREAVTALSERVVAVLQRTLLRVKLRQ